MAITSRVRPMVKDKKEDFTIRARVDREQIKGTMVLSRQELQSFRNPRMHIAQVNRCTRLLLDLHQARKGLGDECCDRID